MARFTAKSNPIRPSLSVLPKSITILATVMNWGWIRALKKTTALDYHCHLARDLQDGSYKGIWRNRCPDEGNSYIKWTGVVVGISKRATKRYKKPVLWAWLELFSLFRSTNSKATHYLTVTLFIINTLKGIAKAPSVGPLRLDILRGTKFFFRPLTGTMSTPVLIIWESTPTPRIAA